MSTTYLKLDIPQARSSSFPPYQLPLWNCLSQTKVVIDYSLSHLPHSHPIWSANPASYLSNCNPESSQFSLPPSLPAGPGHQSFPWIATEPLASVPESISAHLSLFPTHQQSGTANTYIVYGGSFAQNSLVTCDLHQNKSPYDSLPPVDSCHLCYSSYYSCSGPMKLTSCYSHNSPSTVLL